MFAIFSYIWLSLFCSFIHPYLKFEQELPTSVTLWAYVEKKVVNLKGPDKRVWPVLYHHKFGIKALTSGWKNFFTSYKLQIGDECAFILENEAETIFRIDVNSK